MALFSKLGKGLRAALAGVVLTGSAMASDHLSSLKPGIQFEKTKNIESWTISAKIGENVTHDVLLSFLEEDRPRSADSEENLTDKSFRGRYSFEFPLAQDSSGVLLSKSSVAFGHVKPELTGLPEFNENLFGFRQNFTLIKESSGFKLTLAPGWQTTVLNLNDFSGKFTKKDNYALEFNGALEAKINNLLTARVAADSLQKYYNQELYFFNEKVAKDRRFTLEGMISFPSFEITPFIGYQKADIERNGAVDLEANGFGCYARKSFSNFNIFLKGGYAKFTNRKGNDIRFTGGVVCNSSSKRPLTIEFFARQFNDGFAKDLTVGAGFVFGLDKLRGNNFVNEFYVDNGNLDANISLEEQAKRLNSIRKRSEWTERNLHYEIGQGFRDKDSVYSLRTGDCDEQANLNLAIDRMNGNKGYLLGWNDGISRAHAAELIQDKIDGQWYLTEYGHIFKVNVDKNADIQTVGREALRQNHIYSGREILNPDNATFAVYEDGSPPDIYIDYPEWAKKLGSVGPLPSERKRPQIEYGHELFTRRNFLFED